MTIEWLHCVTDDEWVVTLCDVTVLEVSLCDRWRFGRHIVRPVKMWWLRCVNRDDWLVILCESWRLSGYTVWIVTIELLHCDIRDDWVVTLCDLWRLSGYIVWPMKIDRLHCVRSGWANVWPGWLCIVVIDSCVVQTPSLTWIRSQTC